MAKRKIAHDEPRYKSDVDIAKEFEGMSIEDLTVRPKEVGGQETDELSVSLTLNFPEGDESVGGGSDTTTEWFTLTPDENGNYKCEFLGFQNWYPDEVALEIFKLLEQKLTEEVGTTVYFVKLDGRNMIDLLEQSIKRSSKKVSAQKYTTEQLEHLLHWANAEVNYSAGLKELAEVEGTEKVYESLPQELKDSDGESIKDEIGWGDVEDVSSIITDHNVFEDTDMVKGGRIYLLAPQSVDDAVAEMVLRILANDWTKEDYKEMTGEDIGEDEEPDVDLIQFFLDDAMDMYNLVFINPYDRNGYVFDFLGETLYKDADNNVYIPAGGTTASKKTAVHYPEDAHVIPLTEDALDKEKNIAVPYTFSEGGKMREDLEYFTPEGFKEKFGFEFETASKKTAMADFDEAYELGYDVGKEVAEDVAEDNPQLKNSPEDWVSEATEAEAQRRIDYSPIDALMEGLSEKEELEASGIGDSYEQGVADGIYAIVYGKEGSMVASKKEVKAMKAILEQVYKPGLAEEAVQDIQSFDLEDLEIEDGRYQIMVDTIAGGAVGRYQPAYAAEFFGIKKELLDEIKEHIKEDPDSLHTTSPVTYDEESESFVDAEGNTVSDDEMIADWEWSWETIEEVANDLSNQIDAVENLPEPYDDGVWYFGHNDNDGDYGLFYIWEKPQED